MFREKEQALPALGTVSRARAPAPHFLVPGFVMNTGTIELIYIAPAATAPTLSVKQAVAIPGSGLEGDRYALGQGTFSKPEPDFELTLIEAEAIEALKRDYNVDLAPGETRRNLVTRGIALNHLVGQDFQIGEVKAHGIRLCEPCDHLQRLAGRPVIKGLRHRGGLRAQVLTRGAIRVGDSVSAHKD
jgi:MOSC domain-containing protein YiiM